MRQYSHQLTVLCPLPIFKPIAYKLSLTNRKQKYFKGKTTTTLKIKQTSIAMVRNHILTVACFSTPSPPFSLPTTFKGTVQRGRSGFWKKCLTGIGEDTTLFVAAFPIVNEIEWCTIDIQYFNKSTFPASLLAFVLSV